MSHPSTPVVFDGLEFIVADWLRPQLAVLVPDVTVAARIPAGRTSGSAPHVLVACDAVDGADWPIAQRATIRLTAWAADSDSAQRVAARAVALMLMHPGDSDIASVLPLLGVTPADDPDTKAPIASGTVEIVQLPRALS